MTKTSLKNQAIALRKTGKSYSQILKEVSVSKSTLSLWLKSVQLTNKQRQHLLLKRDLATHKGGAVKRANRIEKMNNIIKQASFKVSSVTDKDLWIAGIMLYWAEGTKEKEYNPGTNVIFSNSDPEMIRVYLKWLKESLKIKNDRIHFEIYIHESYKNGRHELGLFWSKITGFPLSNFDKVYYKRDKVSGNRKNKGVKYHGLLRIVVRKSSYLNRTIAGWVEGFCRQCNSAESSNGRTPLFGSGYSRFES